LAFCVYQKKPLHPCNRNWGVFKRNIGEMRSVPESRMQQIPTDLKEFIKLLLSTTPDIRPSAEQVSQLPYFEDVGVKTLTNLDAQFQWDNAQKSKFYKGLPAILPKLPHRVALHRVLPCLAKEFVNHDMVPFVLPSALQIAEEATERDYVEHILPHLKPVMKITDPIQVLLIFMQRMDLLLVKTPPADVKTDVLPMVYRALESDASQIQELCLAIIPNFAGTLDRQSLKSSLLPRIKKLCISTTLLSVRVNSLICIGKLISHMDKWQVIDDVLPMFQQIPSKEPAVIMAIIGILKLTLSNPKIGLTKEVMATRVLPFLLPLSIENGLSLPQFDTILALIKDILARIESEHRTKLEQLTSIHNDQKSALQLSMSDNLTLPPGQLVAAPSSLDSSMFSGLGLDDYVNQDKSTIVNKMLSQDNGVNKGPAQAMAKSASSHGLSLQEKQRLLREQENAKRGPLTSGSATQRSPNQAASRSIKINNQSTQPTDLTNTLVNKSLSMNMSQMTNKVPSPAWPNVSLTCQSSGMPLQPMGMSTASFPAFGGVQPTAAKPDLSSFDNILAPSIQTRAPVPMNSMASKGVCSNPGIPLQPSQPHHLGGTFQSTNIKPLSSNDINDFLS